ISNKMDPFPILRVSTIGYSLKMSRAEPACLYFTLAVTSEINWMVSIQFISETSPFAAGKRYHPGQAQPCRGVTVLRGKPVRSTIPYPKQYHSHCVRDRSGHGTTKE